MAALGVKFCELVVLIIPKLAQSQHLELLGEALRDSPDPWFGADSDALCVTSISRRGGARRLRLFAFSHI